MGFLSKLAHGWNAFLDQDEATRIRPMDLGASYGVRPDRPRLTVLNERSIISSIYTRLSIDGSSIDMRHVKLDELGRYKEDISSGLNYCMNTEANIDQESRAFFIELYMQLLDTGHVAVAPIDTTTSPSAGGMIDIQTMRIGNVVSWFPRHVRVNLYNDITGRREEVLMDKRNVAIIQNPLYSVMNEPNSTLQRLIRKLNLLDAVEEQSGSGKLDLIIQLPYVIKSEAKRSQAEQRRKDIELQMKDSQYGIAYTDGTEKITQLNRPAENNLLKTVEYLTEMLYSQLGLTAEVMNGTADEAAMLNYINRTIEPLIGAVAGEFRRKFLTKTARTQGHTIQYFRDPFKLVPMKDLAEMVDKFTRNEVFSSNEMRTFMGVKPSDDPKADLLVNSNMPQPLPLDAPQVVRGEVVEPEPAVDPYEGISTTLDEIFDDLGVPRE